MLSNKSQSSQPAPSSMMSFVAALLALLVVSLLVVLSTKNKTLDNVALLVFAAAATALAVLTAAYNQT